MDHPRLRRLAIMALVIVSAVPGCLGHDGAPPDRGLKGPIENQDGGGNSSSSLADYPWSFTPVTLAKGAPASYGGSVGEPSIKAAPDGALFVVFTGCDNGLPYIGALGPAPDPSDTCPAPVVFRSRDNGTSWTRLNGPDGRLSADAGPGRADNLVRSDALGRIYVLGMGSDTLEMQRSDDGGDTWTWLGDLNEGGGVDRPWLDAVGDGRLALVWRQGVELVIRTSDDAGQTWSATESIARKSGDGQILMDPEGRSLFVPYVPESSELVAQVLPDPGLTMHVWRKSLTDGSIADIDTGIAMNDDQRSGQLTLIALARDGLGTLALAWDEKALVGAAPTQDNVRYTFSPDNGLTWTAAQVAQGAVSMVMPALAGLQQGGFALAAYGSATIGDPEYVGPWDLLVTRLDPRASPIEAEHAVAETAAHPSGICTQGAMCSSDRTLLDLIEATQAPDGGVYVAYTADPAAEGKQAQIRVAIQSRGPAGVQGHVP